MYGAAVHLGQVAIGLMIAVKPPALVCHVLPALMLSTTCFRVWCAPESMQTPSMWRWEPSADSSLRTLVTVYVVTSTPPSSDTNVRSYSSEFCAPTQGTSCAPWAHQAQIDLDMRWGLTTAEREDEATAQGKTQALDRKRCLEHSLLSCLTLAVDTNILIRRNADDVLAELFWLHETGMVNLPNTDTLDMERTHDEGNPVP